MIEIVWNAVRIVGRTIFTAKHDVPQRVSESQRADQALCFHHPQRRDKTDSKCQACGEPWPCPEWLWGKEYSDAAIAKQENERTNST